MGTCIFPQMIEEGLWGVCTCIYFFVERVEDLCTCVWVCIQCLVRSDPAVRLGSTRCCRAEIALQALLSFPFECYLLHYGSRIVLILFGPLRRRERR